jgi:isopentenyldiphosphate isomerase
MSEEWVDIVDDLDRIIGRKTRRAMREQNLLHRNIAVMCLDPQGRIYVHRRASTKDVFPGMYDVFVGGVVSAGESYDHCAEREIAEELGIRGPRPESLFKYRYEGTASRSHTAVYRVVWDGTIVHQASEVAWGQHMTTHEILEKSQTWPFVPDGWEIFQRYLRGV